MNKLSMALMMALMALPLLACGSVFAQSPPAPMSAGSQMPATHSARVLGRGVALPGALLLTSPRKGAPAVAVLPAQAQVEVLDHIENGITEEHSELWWFARSGVQIGWLSSEHFLSY